MLAAKKLQAQQFTFAIAVGQTFQRCSSCENEITFEQTQREFLNKTGQKPAASPFIRPSVVLNIVIITLAHRCFPSNRLRYLAHAPLQHHTDSDFTEEKSFLSPLDVWRLFLASALPLSL